MSRNANGAALSPDGVTAIVGADPKIAMAQVTPGGTVNGEKDYNLEVTALSPGAAEVRIFDSAGALFERLPLDVRRVKSFSFAQFVAVDKPSCSGCVETQTIDEVVVAVREASKAIYAQPRDEGGAQLEATSGYEFDVEDSKVARLDCVIGLCITVGEDNQSVRGVAKGTTRFLVTGAGVESGLRVVVR